MLLDNTTASNNTGVGVNTPIRIWTMEADDWRCKCHGTFKAKCVSGSKIAAKLNIPARLVFVILKQAETVQLNNERRRAGAKGRGLEKVRAPAGFPNLKIIRTKREAFRRRPEGVERKNLNPQAGLRASHEWMGDASRIPEAGLENPGSDKTPSSSASPDSTQSDEVKEVMSLEAALVRVLQRVGAI